MPEWGAEFDSISIVELTLFFVERNIARYMEALAVNGGTTVIDVYRLKLR